ncbi:SPOR domain-containing protein [Sphingomonas adhaesiva]|uniref:SPOR domain-containing protein n=1 Tax=Sphingomonas adhaesiva TaxID=28212 RepID=UPI002FFC6FC6
MSNGRTSGGASRWWGAAMALSAVAWPVAGAAQSYPMVQPLNPDADRLADVVRRLGASPRDLSALIEAGELSFRLGDATAAAALYKRAEAIDPANGRVKAGIAQILVNGERPGEALRYFEQAQRYGAPMAGYASDRGLAYDLIGEQERAQRDYRVALAQSGGNADDLDEARRRYALSLGISGRQAEALEQIDALLRKSDRGAWRARAFILAMNGDVAGANRIATSMMPAGMAGGLAAFFQRLPTLRAADRAFAVHFGEVAPTPSRIADARMTPALPALGPDPTAPRRVEVAAVAPTPVAKPAQRLSRSEQRRLERDAARQPREPAANPPRTQTAAVAPAIRPGAAASTAWRPAPAPTPILPPAQTVVSTPLPATQPDAGLATTTTRALPQQTAAATPLPTTQPYAGSVATPARTLSQRTVPPTPQPSAGAVSAVTRTPAPAIAAAPIPAPTPIPTPAPAILADAETTPSAATPPAQIAAAAALPARPTSVRQGEDTILARIIAGISVPATELDVAPMPRAVPVVAAPAAPGSSAALDEAARVAERNAAADEERRQRLAARKAAAEKVLADRRTKEAAEKKAKDLAAKKEAAEKAAAEKKAARAEPARIWVQVAGGANEGDLLKAWKAVQGKTPALEGKRAYSTPLRATNRVVTGPFKTEAEARAFVNTLTKQGLSAFSFTSAAGQKMTRLDAK